MSGTPDRLAAALSDRYRIERELGQGGMATVYLAEDLKHDRKVAIKVLKPDLAAVLGAERFIAEIKTTAALSHPHILPLFDSGEVGGFLYYVMPYIEGETIREKLTRETQFGIDEAVRITTEVADALDYAHRHGVIHRDIKPENILLHDGRAMVMDFGIALAVSAAAGGRMTETGLSLGTPHYMSPEQATADKQITARSDVYSLATVLYEMLAGDPPHMGNSAQQIIMKIIADTPRPVSDLRKSIPPNVSAALARALETLPADRFEGARVFAEALGNPAYAYATETGQGVGSGRSRFRAASWVTATMALGALAAGILIGRNTDADAAAWPIQFLVALPDSITSVTRCCGRAFALSPDGRTLVFVGMNGASGALYRLSLDQVDAELIPGTEDGASPFFSPDGIWLGFEASGTLKKMRVAGGPAVPIIESGPVSNATWTVRDQIVYATTSNGNTLWTISAAGGQPVQISSHDSTSLRGFPYPIALPDGRAVLSSVGGGRGTELADRMVVVVDLETGRVDTLGHGTSATYADGYLFIGREDGTLAVQPFDAAKRRTTGEPTTILRGLARRGPWQLAFFASDGGTLAYERSSVEGEFFVAQYTRLMIASVGRGLDSLSGQSARVLPVTAPPPVAVFEPAIAPNGQHLVIREPNANATALAESLGDLYILDLGTGIRSRLTSGGATNPVWTRDGDSVTYRAFGGRDGKSGIYSRAANRSGTPTLVLDDPDVHPSSYLPDGRLLITRQGRQSDQDIGVLVPGDSVPQWMLQTAASESQPMASPDGTWLAFVRDGSIWLAPMADPGAAVEVSAGLGESPRWSRDGRTLYYLALPARTVVAATLAGATVVDRATISAQMAPLPAVSGSATWDIFPDETRILFIEPAIGGAAPELVVVQHWPALIRAMAGKP